MLRAVQWKFIFLMNKKKHFRAQIFQTFSKELKYLLENISFYSNTLICEKIISQIVSGEQEAK